MSPSSFGKADLVKQLKIDRDGEPATRGRRWILPAAVLLALAAAVAAWMLYGERPLEVPVQMARAESIHRSGSSVLDATGYVTARRAATVSSKVTGKVTSVLVEEGMFVEAGQIVAYLDDSNVRRQLALEEANMESARAQLTEAQARLDEAAAALERARALAGRNLVSLAELDTAQSNYASLAALVAAREAGILSARRRVELQEQNLDDLVLRAPFSGVVVAKNAQPGEIISPVSAGGGFTRTGICSLVDMGSLEIQVDVNEAYIQRVFPNQPVQAILDAYPDWRIPAQVIAVIPTADRQRATVRVRIRFQELDSRILPDMGVRVSFLEPESPEEPEPASTAGLRVPSAALKNEGGRTVVFVVRDGRAVKRPVDVERHGGSSWITAGLEAGEFFVSDIPSRLEDGMAVITR